MTLPLIAKPIIENQYWIVTDGKQKIGNITVNNNNVHFSINNKTEKYNDISTLSKNHNINFENSNTDNLKDNIIYTDYPASGKMYNAIVDLQKKIQLYTTSPESKSYYAAGYFNIEMNNVWQTHYCPKYIYIQRYKYNGPYKTLKECELVRNQYDKY